MSGSHGRISVGQVARHCALISLGIIVALAMAEGSLRTTSVASDNFWQPDPVIGHFLIPGKKGVWRSECFSAPVEINSKGFRDHEFPYDKAPGRSRIVVLGDSMTEALQVSAEETFPKLLEKLLNGTVRDKGVEVLNLAVSGYGTAQQYLLLSDRGLRFQPDLVVVAFFSLNDVRESSLHLEGRADKPYFYLDETGQVALRSFRFPPPYHGVKQLVRSLHLYRFFGARLARIDVAREFLLWTGIGTQINPELDREARHRGVADVPFDLQVYLKEYPRKWKEAWDVISAILRKAKEDVQKAGGRLLVVALPSILEVVDADKVRAQYPAFREERFDTEAPYRALESVAKAHDIPYLSLLPAFRSAVRAGTHVDDLYYPCDLHFAPGGHRLIARELARAVEPLLR